ncbi:hypothetical protein D3C81_2070680 [compost metagenome]
MPAISLGRSGYALAYQPITNHHHTFFMQRQMRGLEESMPGGQPNHVAIMQPFFYRQVIPVKDRVTWRDAPQTADA